MVESISFETLMNADGMAAFRWFDGLKQDETGLIYSSQEAWPHGFSSVFKASEMDQLCNTARQFLKNQASLS